MKEKRVYENENKFENNKYVFKMYKYLIICVIPIWMGFFSDGSFWKDSNFDSI